MDPNGVQGLQFMESMDINGYPCIDIQFPVSGSGYLTIQLRGRVDLEEPRVVSERGVS